MIQEFFAFVATVFLIFWTFMLSFKLMYDAKDSWSSLILRILVISVNAYVVAKILAWLFGLLGIDDQSF